MLGPKAQEVLRPWLARDPESYCFVPAEAAAWHRARTRRRQSARNSQRRAGAGKPRRGPGPRYTRHS